MMRKSASCFSRTVFIKSPVALLRVVVSAVLLSTLFHTDPVLGDGCPAPSFAAARAFDAGGGSAMCVTVGDFNGDGNPDLAVSKVFEEGAIITNLVVLLGNGDGTFQASVGYRAAGSPSPVAVTDLNGDGRPDLAAADGGSDTIDVLLGRGDGTFQDAVKYAAGPFVNGVAVGDFNRDGKLDLVAANGAGVSVLLGNGDGTFRAAGGYGTGLYPSSVAVGDFDGDGKLDLAVANSGGFSRQGSVSVLLGNGDGTFRTAVNFAEGTSPWFVTVGDLNGDGNPDLAIGGGSATGRGGVSVLLGKGDGTFQSAVTYDGGAGSVALDDLDGDGKPDLVVGDRSGVSVLLNTCASAGVYLGVTRRNSNFTLSWPIPSAGFILESTASLGSTNWQRVLESPTTNSGRWQLTAPFDQPGRFFRLRKP